MSKQVTLINTPISLEERYGKEIKDFGAVTEPLGLAYIAGTLESKAIPVSIIDGQAQNLSPKEVIDILTQQCPQIVGLSVLTTIFTSVKNLCTLIRRALPDCLIVLGGPHCSALPERTLQEIREADVVCIGEGEFTLVELATNEPNKFNNIPGICFRKGGQFIKTEKRPFVKDLDQIPPPARHLLPMESYHLTASRVSGGSYCPTIIVARGCPFGCTYCSRTFGRSFRKHSVNRIIKEIEHLIDTHHVDQINIEADTLTAKKSFLIELCNELINKGINKQIKWTCESRVDTIDEEMLRLMKKAGCWQISYGVETGSQRLLDKINKGVTLDQVRTTFLLTKEVGITIRGFFMLGLPTETLRDSLNTISFAKELDPLWAQFTITVPYPGTVMFDELADAGEIRTFDWSKYNTWSGWKDETQIPFVAKGRTIKELSGLQKKALRDFYFRPIVILRFLKHISSIHEFKKYLSGAIVLLKSLANKNCNYSHPKKNKKKLDRFF